MKTDVTKPLQASLHQVCKVTARTAAAVMQLPATAPPELYGDRGDYVKQADRKTPRPVEAVGRTLGVVPLDLGALGILLKVFLGV